MIAALSAIAVLTFAWLAWSAAKYARAKPRVLRVLANNGGYMWGKDIATYSGCTLGTLYNVLADLRDAGCVESVVGDWYGRRVYRITAHGRATLAKDYPNA